MSKKPTRGAKKPLKAPVPSPTPTPPAGGNAPPIGSTICTERMYAMKESEVTLLAEYLVTRPWKEVDSLLGILRRLKKVELMPPAGP